MGAVTKFDGNPISGHAPRHKCGFIDVNKIAGPTDYDDILEVAQYLINQSSVSNLANITSGTITS